jgi:hypothetical protein
MNGKYFIVTQMKTFTPAAESHGLWPSMKAFGRDVAPLGL